MECRGAGIESSAKAFPPSIEQGVDRVWRPGAELGADSRDRGALAGMQQGIGSVFDIACRDAAPRRAGGLEGCRCFGHVTNNTQYDNHMKSYLWKSTSSGQTFPSRAQPTRGRGEGGAPFDGSRGS